MPLWYRALKNLGVGLGQAGRMGDPAVYILQESRYPALVLAAASVSPAFVIWHSIFAPIAHPHSPWKVGQG